MSARLYQIQKDLPGHLWCGPAALCAVTGEPLSVVLEAVRHHRLHGGSGKNPDRITTMWSREIPEVLRLLGHRFSVLTTRGDRPTFAQWRKNRGAAERATPHIVLAAHHFVAVLGNRLVDSRHTDPILASEYSRQRIRVVQTISVGSAA